MIEVKAPLSARFHHAAIRSRSKLLGGANPQIDRRRQADMRHLSDMICNQNPLIMSCQTTVHAACKQMDRRKAGSVLVADKDGKLIGIFTGRDAVRRVLAAGKSADSQLRDVMTANPVTVTPEKTPIDALRLMWDGGFRHLPLVQNGKILGVVSRGDFQSDEQLRLDEERQFWEHMR